MSLSATSTSLGLRDPHLAPATAPQQLAWTALGICEVDNAVNKWRKPVLETGIDIRRMVPKTGFYDQVKA